MPNSWDDYYNHYSDWDEAHCFNVRIQLRFEENLKCLGYSELLEKDFLFSLENSFIDKALPQNKTYVKNEDEIILSFEVRFILLNANLQLGQQFLQVLQVSFFPMFILF